MTKSKPEASLDFSINRNQLPVVIVTRKKIDRKQEHLDYEKRIHKRKYKSQQDHNLICKISNGGKYEISDKETHYDAKK